MFLLLIVYRVLRIEASYITNGTTKKIRKHQENKVCLLGSILPLVRRTLVETMTRSWHERELKRSMRIIKNYSMVLTSKAHMKQINSYFPNKIRWTEPIRPQKLQLRCNGTKEGLVLEC